MFIMCLQILIKEFMESNDMNLIFLSEKPEG